MNLLLNWWQKLSDTGIQPDMNAMEVFRIQILNKCLGIGLIFDSITIVVHLFRPHWIPEVAGFFLITIFVGLLLLQKHQHFFIARILVCTILPLHLAGLIVVSNASLPGEYYLFIVILVGLILFKRTMLQAGVAVYSIICFISAIYIDSVIGLNLGIHPDILDRAILFSAAALCLLSIGWLFIREYLRYLQSNQLLVSQLKLQNEDLERFTHIASHDLKTPLRNIISFLDLINKRQKNQSIGEVQPYFDRINRSARQMHALVDDIMSFTLHKRENYVLEAVDLHCPVEMAINQLQNQIEERNVQIKLPDNSPSVTGQRNQLAVVFQNLFENAIKYNESSPPVITITTQEIDSEVIIQIQDNGVGLAPGFEEKIFEMFERLHPSEHYEGTGLGLAICRRILQLMDATIEATSNDTGALFTIKMKPSEKHQ